MTSLPTYQEATSRLDWLDFVAPYVTFTDYRALCVVNRHFWAVFAPKLWADPLKTARRSGLDPGDDLTWWFDFVFQRLVHVSPKTRELVRVLDAREFAKDAYHFALDEHESTLQQSFKRALGLFTSLEALLLDGHTDLDLSLLIGQHDASATHRPLVLSIADCPTQLLSSFFNSPCLQGLVSLDISGIPGSIGPLIQPTLLLDLRILKVRGREMDDATFKALATLFGLRLWSLDLSDNRITDGAIQTLREWCMPVVELRSAAHFQVEGKLVPLPETNEASYQGQFVCIQESEWSGSFNHPERYFVDTPLYVSDPHAEQPLHLMRSDGRSPGRKDSADAAVSVFSRENSSNAMDNFRATHGLTHLHLSNNHISAFGIEKLLRISNGQLEHLACDSMPLLSPSGGYAKYWPKTSKLCGILGMAHVFRPVFSSNLRELRIHHSLVTNIATLEVEGLPNLARIFLSENSILPRADQAYPQTFIPDMNPRLTSLTLTCLSRRSSGPLIGRLLRFLRLLSIQERAIQEANQEAASSWRGPRLLQGLRHLRLEFEPDSMDDGFSTAEDLDAEELMNSGDRGFSFFDGKVDGTSWSGAKPRSQVAATSNSSAGRRGTGDTSGVESDRDRQTFVNYDGERNGRVFSAPVWIGPPKKTTSNPSSGVLAEYRRLVLDGGLRDGVGPATPSQVAAGAPKQSLVFQTAWCVAVMPRELPAPARSELAGMVDVLVPLKRYRLAGRAKYMELKKRMPVGSGTVPLGEPHLFWTGRLEVSTEEAIARRKSSGYWK